MTYDKTIRTKQSLLASKRYYYKAILQFISLVETFTSILQIYTFLIKSIPILLCKSKCNTFTLLHLENIYTTYPFMYFILGRRYLFISLRSKAVDLFPLFSLYQNFFCQVLPKSCCWYHSLLFFLFNSYIFNQWWAINGGH